MAIFSSYVKLPEGIMPFWIPYFQTTDLDLTCLPIKHGDGAKKRYRFAKKNYQSLTKKKGTVAIMVETGVKLRHTVA